jgi:hypothetical protein
MYFALNLVHLVIVYRVPIPFHAGLKVIAAVDTCFFRVGV